MTTTNGTYIDYCKDNISSEIGDVVKHLSKEQVDHLQYWSLDDKDKSPDPCTIDAFLAGLPPEDRSKPFGMVCFCRKCAVQC